MRILLPLLILGCSVSPQVIPIPERDRLFDRDRGWSGGDVATSIPLSDRRILWLFGDSVFDRGTKSPRVIRNSIAIQDGTSIQFHAARDGKAFFRPEQKDRWYWPISGVRRETGLYIWMMTMQKTDGEGVFAFRMLGGTMVTIPNPDDAPLLWNISIRNFPWSFNRDGVNQFFGSAALLDGDYLYLYGTRREKNLESGKGGGREWKREMVLARTADCETWEFLSQEGWTSSSDSLLGLAREVAAEFSVVKKSAENYILITSAPDMSSTITALQAPRPEGPWSDPRVIYRCPERNWSPDYFCYAAKAHPELSTGDSLVLTYACNSTNFLKMLRDPQIYRPRFLDLLR